MNRRESSVRTRKLAVSAMLSALGTVFLYIGSATNILDLTSVAIASLLIFFAVMEMGTPYQYLIYGQGRGGHLPAFRRDLPGFQGDV